MDEDVDFPHVAEDSRPIPSDFTEAILSHLALICILISIIVTTIAWFIRDSFKVDRFDQKHVLITGCDTGFGNLVAMQLDRKGFHVIATCLTEGGAWELRTATSPRLKTVLLNVTDSASVRSAVEFVRAEVGERGLWGLVNNAGRSMPIGPTEWMQKEDFQKVLDVNLLGLIDVTLQFLPLLKKAQGRVVNVGSILGRVALTGGGYCVSKYGVEAFSDSLRREMVHFGLKVCLIEPGFFKTGVTRMDLLDDDLRRMWTSLPQEVRDSYGDNFLDRFTRAQHRNMGMLLSPDISKVTDCMEHALTARHPRTRYSAGWDAKFFWIPLSYMPAIVSDFVINITLPVPKKNRHVE